MSSLTQKDITNAAEPEKAQRQTDTHDTHIQVHQQITETFRDPLLKPGEQHNYIFAEQDLARVEGLKRKVITMPLTFLLLTSTLTVVAKRMNLRRLIANPLKDEAQISKNDKYWRYATLNGIMMGTLGFTWFAFQRGELNKIILFKKYEKQVAMYMKWRTERETREYLKKGPVDLE